MRRLSYLLAAVLLIACTKEPERTKTVTFSLSDVATGDLPTKVTSSDIAPVLSATLPSSDATITIQSKTKPNRVYTAKIGDSVSIAYDSYTVSGEWESSQVGSCLFGKLYSKPTYSVSGNIVVTDADETYPLTASWTSSAFVFPKDLLSVQVSSITSGYDYITDCVTVVGDKSVVYVKGGGWSDEKPLTFVLTPNDDVNYEESYFSFITVTPGRWYYISPDAVSVTGGDFVFNFPEWTGGN